MSKIPTAEEFGTNKLPRGIDYWHKEFNEMMIEFAKFHVQEALKKASEEAKIIQKVKKNVHELSMMDDWMDTFVDKNSILNAYLDENIK